MCDPKVWCLTEMSGATVVMCRCVHVSQSEELHGMSASRRCTVSTLSELAIGYVSVVSNTYVFLR